MYVHYGLRGQLKHTIGLHEKTFWHGKKSVLPEQEEQELVVEVAEKKATFLLLQPSLLKAHI
jgi:hypothetical protein